MSNTIIIRDRTDKLIAGVALNLGYRPGNDVALSESERLEFRRLGRPEPLPIILKDLQEATTASIPEILASVSTKVIRQYMSAPGADPTEGLVRVRRLSDLKKQTVVKMGGFGGIPVYGNEGQELADLGIMPEFRTDFDPITRGGRIVFTRRMFKNADPTQIQNIVKEAAAACIDTKLRFVTSQIMGNSGGGAVNSDTVYDGDEIYHANHGNLITTALSLANIQAMRRGIKRQWVPGPSTILDNDGGIDDEVTTIGLASVAGIEPGMILKIGNELIKVGAVDSVLVQVTGCGRGMYGTAAASHSDEAPVQIQSRPVSYRSLNLLLPDTLEDKAYEFLASDQLAGSNAKNRTFDNQQHGERKINVVSLHPSYLADDENNYYLMADQESVPTVEIGFLDGNEFPEVVQVDGTKYQGDSLGTMTFGVFHDYGAAVTDWRGLQGGLVA